MKKRTDLWKMVSMVMLSAILMAGCSKGESASETVPASVLKDGKYDPPFTITIAKQQDENAGKYINGETLNDNVLTRWGKNKTWVSKSKPPCWEVMLHNTIPSCGWR
ncbi:hypothetical protein Q0F98_37170 [Paenibacillus amylolyticus]|nr:hypothetical protein Q0F98_37170 [Paenibacillus amylolyticus]